MSESACDIPSIPIQLTGPLVIGYQLNWALYGVLVAQVYIYYQTSATDGWRTKSIVYISFLIQTAQVILASSDEFWELAYSFGNLRGLTSVYSTWLSLPWLTGITSATIQCYYAWRIFVLNRSRAIAAFIIAGALTQGSAAIAEGIETVRYHIALDIHTKNTRTTSTWLGGAAACNILICLLMIYLKFKSSSPFVAHETSINKALFIAVESGMLTAVLSTLAFILFLTFEHAFYHIAPILMLSKMYCNSLLALLNNRIALRPSQVIAESTFDFNSQATYAQTQTTETVDRDSASGMDTENRHSTDVLSTAYSSSVSARLTADKDMDDQLMSSVQPSVPRRSIDTLESEHAI